MSRRRWDGRIRNWRRNLHSWYDMVKRDVVSSQSNSSSSPSSFASGVQSRMSSSENGNSVKDVEGMFANFNFSEQNISAERNNSPHLNNNQSLSNHSCETTYNDLYACIYYQMMVQQNLILGWLFQNSSNPDFASTCELLEQFFTQQAVILNCLSQVNND